MKKLTKKQEIVFDYIKWFWIVNRFPPTIREIQQDLKFKYPNSVFSILCSLEEKQYISMESNKSRTIRIINW